jgi:hypothetical protein
MKKYFEILGIPEGSSQEVIQEAYDKLSKELNPKNNDNQEFFVEEFEKLKEAYKSLSNSTILKSSEKSYINSDVNEVQNESSIKKPNNDSITITISPEKIEDLKRNVQSNSNLSENNKISLSFKVLCIVNIIFSSLYFIAFLAVFYTKITFDDNIPLGVTLIISLVYALFSWCALSTLIGSYKMILGHKKGYNYFLYGNSVFSLFVLISLFGNNSNNSFAIFIFIISVFFGIVFNGYKKELYL